MEGNMRSIKKHLHPTWRRRAATVLLTGPLVLAAGCGGGGEELVDAIGGLTGDGGKRIQLTGSIMGEQRVVCIDSPPQISPAALQQETDKYLFKTIRWDTGTTVNKSIEDNRSCSYRVSPYMTMTWDQFVADSSVNRQLADWGNFSAKFTAQGQRYVNFCMRDNECEDGDILAVSINGKEIARSEIFNEARCLDVQVNPGVNYLGIYAVNGTGNKGQCSYADRNTGEVTVTGASGTGKTQTYSVRGGQGSHGSITIVN